MSGRLHLVELHETRLCPASLRDALTDTLHFYTSLGRPFARLEGRLASALERCSESRVLDLCSGAGGPWPALAERLSERLGRVVQVTLTDLHPHPFAGQRSADAGVPARAEPVDARGVPPQLPGFRTLFSSFHHFRPEEAVAVLRSAAERGVGIGVFEAQARTWGSLLLFLLYLPLTFAAVPLVRPFRASRLFWTYLVPLLPLVITFDALVSCLRSYRVDELEALAAQAFGARMHVEIGQVRAGWLPLWVSYLIATPRVEASARG